jgi:hypothetical protein
MNFNLRIVNLLNFIVLSNVKCGINVYGCMFFYGCWRRVSLYVVNGDHLRGREQGISFEPHYEMLYFIYIMS